MKKTLILFIIAAAVVTLSIVSYSRGGERSLEGAAAPELNLASLKAGAPGISLDGLKGHYVVVSFWSAADPASRMRNMSYENLVSEIDSNLPRSRRPVAFVSVNFDESRSLVTEIAAIDGLDPSTIAQASGPAARRIIRDYDLSEGYDTFLIDPEGRIVSRNPSEDTLIDAVS